MALAGMDDFSALISRARALDAEALTTLHDALYPAVYRYIAYRLGHGPLSEDLTAEVFLRLLEALRAGRYVGEFAGLVFYHGASSGDGLSSPALSSCDPGVRWWSS